MPFDKDKVVQEAIAAWANSQKLDSFKEMINDVKVISSHELIVPTTLTLAIREYRKIEKGIEVVTPHKSNN